MAITAGGKDPKLMIPIGAKDEFSKTFNKFEKNGGTAASRVAAAFKKGAGVIAKSAKKIAIAAAAAAVAIIALIVATAKAGDEFDKMSKRTGVTSQALSELAFAAELSGSNIQTVEKAMKRAQANMLDAANGTGEAKKAFEELGISVLDQNGKLKAADVILNEVAGAFETFEDATRKSALAQRIFGRAGAEMLPLLNEGRKSIEDMRKEARALGITFSGESSAASAKFVDELTRLKSAFKGIGQTISLSFLPFLTDVVTGFKNAVVAAGQFFGLLDEQKQGGGVLGGNIIDIKGKPSTGVDTRAAQLEGQASKLQLLRQQQDVDRRNSILEGGLNDRLDMILFEVSEEQRAADMRRKISDDQLENEKRNSRLRVGVAVNSASAIVNVLDALNTLSDGKNRQQFEALKVARTAQAIVNTYAGATQALASVPYPYNIAAAASVITLGFAQVAAIQRASFGSSGAGQSISGTDTASPSGTDLSGSASQQPEQQPQRITIKISNLFGQDDDGIDKIIDQVIIPAIDRAGERDVVINGGA